MNTYVGRRLRAAVGSAGPDGIPAPRLPMNADVNYYQSGEKKDIS